MNAMVQGDGMSILGVGAPVKAAVAVPLNSITLTVTALIGGKPYSATMKGFMSPTTVPVGSHDSSSIEIVTQVI